MIQYMVACRIAAAVGDCRISNVLLPEWGIHHPLLPGPPDPEVKGPIIPNGFDILAMVNLLSSGERTRLKHRSLEGSWKGIPAQVVAQLRSSVPHRPKRLLNEFVFLFDEAFDANHYGNLAREARAGRLSSGLDHYITHGFSEGRSCFAFDDQWSRTKYPDAAQEFEQGQHESLPHQFLLVGSKRWYKPIPTS